MLLALVLLAQAAAATPAPIAATEVVQAPGKTADQLYSAALAWVPTAFKSTKAVTELADKASGRLVVKSQEPFVPPTLYGRTPLTGPVTYTVTIEAKDGRFRYSVGPFVHETGYGTVTDAPRFEGKTPSSDGGNQKNWAALQKLARETAASLSTSLKAAMEKPPDEW